MSIVAVYPFAVLGSGTGVGGGIAGAGIAVAATASVGIVGSGGITTGIIGSVIAAVVTSVVEISQGARDWSIFKINISPIAVVRQGNICGSA